jgi:hypothetical protein
MDIDFSKRLCDATLGEFVAAERSVAIVTSWAVALTTGAAIFAGRLIWKRIQRKRNEPPEVFADLRREDQ